MPVDNDRHRILYKVSQAYYEDEMTQQQVADRFSLSRSKVSRLLQEARAEGVIEIILIPPSGAMAQAERELERRYGLDEATIVTVTNPEDLASVKRELGPAAAECLLRSISENGVVTIAWGMSILAMVDAVPSRSLPDVTVAQIAGGLGAGGGRDHSCQLTLELARKLGSRPHLLQAPGVVSTAAAAQAIQSDERIAETLDLAAAADVAVVGLGLLSEDTMLLREGTILSSQDVDTLKEAKAVGDVALRYLDGDGQPIDLEINERTIGLTIEQIEKIPRVIGIAGGNAKFDIIRAALRGQILDVLITDHAVARALLQTAAP
ncbi:MAG: sugar-binding domain-containing protein [Anaerolineae bacterium]|jgi:DNA-binding transcriptional regulator LsrR (DeoR family)